MYIDYPQRGKAYYIAVSAVAVMIAITIVEDVLTGGGGVADDPVSVGLAYEIAKAILAFA